MLDRIDCMRAKLRATGWAWLVRRLVFIPVYKKKERNICGGCCFYRDSALTNCVSLGNKIFLWPYSDFNKWVTKTHVTHAKKVTQATNDKFALKSMTSLMTMLLQNYVDKSTQKICDFDFIHIFRKLHYKPQQNCSHLFHTNYRRFLIICKAQIHYHLY